MNTAAYPTDFAVPHGRGRRRMSREALAAVGVSLAVHVGVIGYIANEKFREIKVSTYQEPGVLVQSFLKDKPTPPPPSKEHQPPKAVSVHVPQSDIQPPPEIDPIRTVIVPPTPSIDPPVAIAVTPQPPVFTQLADARPPPAKDRVIRNPSWLRRPSADEMSRIYPHRAMELGQSGAATLSCAVTATGAVRDCSVIDEAPKGRGFGDAALASAKLFRLNPRTVDGEVVEGAKVRIPLVFNLAD